MFPAYAGMNRVMTHDDYSMPDVPRIRGDEPELLR